MTNAQKRLRELTDRRSQERQRMAELGLESELTDETRAELDRIEAGTPDLERQVRAAGLAVEDENEASETRATEGPDAEARERAGSSAGGVHRMRPTEEGSEWVNLNEGSDR